MEPLPDPGVLLDVRRRLLREEAALTSLPPPAPTHGPGHDHAAETRAALLVAGVVAELGVLAAAVARLAAEVDDCDAGVAATLRRALPRTP